MPAVRVMPTPMAELVMVLVILGSTMSHRVVSAAQNRSRNLSLIHISGASSAIISRVSRVLSADGSVLRELLEADKNTH